MSVLLRNERAMAAEHKAARPGPSDEELLRRFVADRSYNRCFMSGSLDPPTIGFVIVPNLFRHKVDFATVRYCLDQSETRLLVFDDSSFRRRTSLRCRYASPFIGQANLDRQRKGEERVIHVIRE